MPDQMNLSIAGLATFAGQPAYTDSDKLDGTDVAILGSPRASFDFIGSIFHERAGQLR